MGQAHHLEIQMANRESDLTRVSTLGDSDFIRVIFETASRNITKSNFVKAIESNLIALGFIQTSADQSRKVETFTVNHSVVSGDSIILMDATAGDLVADLPTAASVFDVSTQKSEVFTIKKKDGSITNKVTVVPVGGELIDGDTNVELLTDARPFITIISDGTDWWLI